MSKVWLEGGQLVQVAAHNPRFFGPAQAGSPDFITQDEESSGFVDPAIGPSEEEEGA